MKRTVQVQYKLDKSLIDRIRGLCLARKEKPEEAINAGMKMWLDKELGEQPKNVRELKN